ncbi:hypothetical protein Tco_0479584, partial [Tanacetum coccineum]
MPPEDDVFPAEEQPLLVAVSPTADSLGYIADSGLEEDEEEDPADRGDDDDDVKEEDEEEEEEEHLALAVASPTVDHAPSAEETKPFETDKSAATPPPHPAYHVMARMSIRPQTL